MKLKTHELFLAPIFRFTRARRMKKFEAKFEPLQPPNCRVLDIGGSCFNWQFVDQRYRVTLLNLYRCDVEEIENIEFDSIQGNGLNLLFDENSFDIAFSNSVIEHVGDIDAQTRFAQEALRVAKKIWIQTPAREFFIEPHFMLPVVHWLPDRIYRIAVKWFCPRRWGSRENKQHVDEMLDEVRLLSKKEMIQLFPDCDIIVERFLFFPKSYIAFKA